MRHIFRAIVVTATIALWSATAMAEPVGAADVSARGNSAAAHDADHGNNRDSGLSKHAYNMERVAARRAGE